ncbi:PQQ-dependent sugar dehydrogenase [Jidongwangia harbinensis]|uniref:PQQ-dependent sugar dehydrogenase n=1 Tax=Jidongwangia harbinensis TaxID=2878561 RepID=UPI001CD98C02|nr:PQQ-dependent sugar dehydrogenase [Jidongwangia harbinensis]MCA2214824.1 PQQ-dependent sugar dehydrogenase [Jidongwangia harbinensis]
MTSATPTRARLALTVVTAGALLTACSGDESGAQPPAPSFAVPSPAGSGSAPAAPSTAPTGTPDLGAPETVATDLNVPWGLAFLPDGSALVAQRDSGVIVQVTPGGGAPREAYRVAGVDAGGEGGLLGVALARDYPKTRWVYAYYTGDDDNRIVRFKLGSDAKPEVIFDGLDKAGIHNGGRIAFGPDGMLYVGTGDAGEGGASQDPGDTNGKILRLTPNGEPAPGNPTDGSPVWSLGHRNVQGLAWDADGTMYGVEFGQNRVDEVNVIKPGKNYGWPEVEGKAGDSRYADPLVTWSTDEASPSGAAVSGDTLYVAALRGERLWTVPLGGGAPKAEFSGRYGRLRTVAVAPDGALWLTTSNTDGRGDEKSGDDRILRFPAR